jgi:hypothetical protein
VVVDRNDLVGAINFIGTEADGELPLDEATRILNMRPSHPDLRPHEKLPDDTRLWAALQNASGGIWSGCVFDTNRIIELLEAGEKALAMKERAGSQ